MRRSLAIRSNCTVGLAAALLALALVLSVPRLGHADPSGSEPSDLATTSAPSCNADDRAHPFGAPSTGEPVCATSARTSAEISAARAYVVETAHPGYTMTLQGPELAVERLHPEFVVRLANAIREARNVGLPFAGIFSAYRPPAFGVGGFADKFN